MDKFYYFLRFLLIFFMFIVGLFLFSFFCFFYGNYSVFGLFVKMIGAWFFFFVNFSILFWFFCCSLGIFFFLFFFFFSSTSFLRSFSQEAAGVIWHRYNWSRFIEYFYQERSRRFLKGHLELQKYTLYRRHIVRDFTVKKFKEGKKEIEKIVLHYRPLTLKQYQPPLFCHEILFKEKFAPAFVRPGLWKRKYVKRFSVSYRRGYTKFLNFYGFSFDQFSHFYYAVLLWDNNMNLKSKSKKVNLLSSLLNFLPYTYFYDSYHFSSFLGDENYPDGILFFIEGGDFFFFREIFKRTHIIKKNYFWPEALSCYVILNRYYPYKTELKDWHVRQVVRLREKFGRDIAKVLLSDFSDHKKANVIRLRLHVEQPFEEFSLVN